MGLDALNVAFRCSYWTARALADSGAPLRLTVLLPRTLVFCTTRRRVLHIIISILILSYRKIPRAGIPSSLMRKKDAFVMSIDVVISIPDRNQSCPQKQSTNDEGPYLPTVPPNPSAKRSQKPSVRSSTPSSSSACTTSKGFLLKHRRKSGLLAMTTCRALSVMAPSPTLTVVVGAGVSNAWAPPSVMLGLLCPVSRLQRPSGVVLLLTKVLCGMPAYRRVASQILKLRRIFFIPPKSGK